MEEVDNLFLRFVIDVAGGIKRVDTGGVLAEFVGPEAFVVTMVVGPKLFHVLQQIDSTKG